MFGTFSFGRAQFGESPDLTGIAPVVNAVFSTLHLEGTYLRTLTAKGTYTRSISKGGSFLPTLTLRGRVD